MNFVVYSHMDEKRLAYIEEAGLLLETSGMTRMAGRIFGYLLICDEDAVSFDRIREVLDASKGSISTNLKHLVHAQLIEPVSLPGDRKTYYRVSHIQIGDIMKNRTELIKKFVKIFAKGYELKTRRDNVSEWLIESTCFYNWMDKQIMDLTARWETEKKDIIQKYKEEHRDRNFIDPSD